MTKKQFQQLAFKNNCSSHYQGSTKTMFVFGSKENLLRLNSEPYVRIEEFIIKTQVTSL